MGFPRVTEPLGRSGCARRAGAGGVAVLAVLLSVSAPSSSRASSIAPARRLTDAEILSGLVARSDVVVLATPLSCTTRKEIVENEWAGQMQWETTLVLAVRRLYKGDLRDAVAPLVVLAPDTGMDRFVRTRGRGKDWIFFLRRAPAIYDRRWPYFLNGAVFDFPRIVFDPADPLFHSAGSSLEEIVQRQRPEALAGRADLVVEGGISSGGRWFLDGGARIPTTAMVRPRVLAGRAPGDTVFVEQVLPYIHAPSIVFLEHVSGSVYRPVDLGAGVFPADGRQPGRRDPPIGQVRAIARRAAGRAR